MFFWIEWNVKEEMDKADYKIKKERPGYPGCPYCGNVNRRRIYRVKRSYVKCEACGKISITHNKY